MTLRRTLLLLALVVLGALLVTIVRPPVRPTGLEAVRGHRVFGAAAVQGVEVSWEGRKFVARRESAGWEIDGQHASPEAAAALADLVAALRDLRAVDVFRPREVATYGFERPRGTIVLTTKHRVRRLVVGELNAAGSALYARREGDARVLQIGLAIASAVERVLYNRDRQRPEIG